MHASQNRRLVRRSAFTAEQITDLLKSALQTVRVAYLNVGYPLSVMRDEIGCFY